MVWFYDAMGQEALSVDMYTAKLADQSVRDGMSEAESCAERHDELILTVHV